MSELNKVVVHANANPPTSPIFPLLLDILVDELLVEVVADGVVDEVLSKRSRFNQLFCQAPAVRN